MYIVMVWTLCVLPLICVVRIQSPPTVQNQDILSHLWNYLPFHNSLANHLILLVGAYMEYDADTCSMREVENATRQLLIRKCQLHVQPVPQLSVTVKYFYG